MRWPRGLGRAGHLCHGHVSRRPTLCCGFPLPFVEPGFLASVLVLGLLIAAAIRLPLTASSLLVGLFALFHGHAHGIEMPETVGGAAYDMGFVRATGLSCCSGIGVGPLAKKPARPRIIRYAGVGWYGWRRYDKQATGRLGLSLMDKHLHRMMTNGPTHFNLGRALCGISPKIPDLSPIFRSRYRMIGMASGPPQGYSPPFLDGPDHDDLRVTPVA